MALVLRRCAFRSQLNMDQFWPYEMAVLEVYDCISGIGPLRLVPSTASMVGARKIRTPGSTGPPVALIQGKRPASSASDPATASEFGGAINVPWGPGAGSTGAWRRLELAKQGLQFRFPLAKLQVQVAVQAAVPSAEIAKHLLEYSR